MSVPDQVDRLVRIAEVEQIVGSERTTISRMVKAGRFPCPIYVGTRRLWTMSSLQAWIRGQATAVTP
jgi:predicted DNA-binding transcriptional regulator AlpA